MSAVRMRFNLLGPFRLRQGDQLLAGFDHARLQHLPAYLVVYRAALISRQRLAFLFWPDSTDQQARKNFRTLLSRLRHALPDADHFIDVTAQTILWRPDEPLTMDVTEFESAVAQAAAAQEARDYAMAANSLAAAAAVYKGDLLPDCYDDWVLPLRERLHQAFGEALERQVLLLEEQREYGSALPYARRLLDHDPLREAAYHHLMRLHLALGDRTEALRVYRACDAMLQREFGTAPARATRDLYEHLLKAEGEPALAVMGQPSETRSTSLPLVGRNAEWFRLMAAWCVAAAGPSQMVLLSGEAGIGKTRLAEELCAQR